MKLDGFICAGCGRVVYSMKLAPLCAHCGRHRRTSWTLLLATLALVAGWYWT